MATNAATLVYDIDASGAVGAAKALGQMERAAASLATMSAKVQRQFRNEQGQFISSADAARQNESAILRLADAYNPALSAQLRFAQTQKDVAEAVRLGVIAADQQADVLRRLEAQYSVSANGVRVMGGGYNNLTTQVQNAGYQIGDFAVQVASGQNAVMALSQQLPQLLGGFGAIGAVLGAGTAIAGAFFMAMGAGESTAQKLTKSLDNVNEALEELRRLDRSLTSDGIDDLIDRYGAADTAVVALLNSQRQYNQILADKELKDSLNAISEFASGRWYDIGVSDAASGILRLRDTLNITANDAQVFQQAIDNVGRARGYSEQADALQIVADYLGVILSTNEEVTDEQLAMYDAVNDAIDATRQLVAISGDLPGQFDSAARSARAIADALADATAQAARMAAAAVSDARYAQINLDYRTDEVGRAGALAAAKFDEEFRGAGIDSFLYDTMRQQAIDASTEAARIMAQVDALNDADRDAARDGRKSASDAAKDTKRTREEMKSRVEELQEGFLSESAITMKKYAEDQETLKWALDQRMITLEEYKDREAQLRMMSWGTEAEIANMQYQAELQGLNEALEQKYLTQAAYNERVRALEQDHQDKIRGIQGWSWQENLTSMSSVFGAMADLQGGNNEKMLKAQRTFAAASALINAYEAGSQVLRNPDLPWFAKIGAAGSIIAAGLGMVSAIKGGGAGGSSRASSTPATPTTKQEPVKNIMVKIDGDEIFGNMAESIMQQIYRQSENGRVIIARG